MGLAPVEDRLSIGEPAGFVNRSISDIDTIADSEDDVVGRLPAPQSRGLIYSDSRLSR
jgi:hypothetical protein